MWLLIPQASENPPTCKVCQLEACRAILSCLSCKPENNKSNSSCSKRCCKKHCRRCCGKTQRHGASKGCGRRRARQGCFTQKFFSEHGTGTAEGPTKMYRLLQLRKNVVIMKYLTPHIGSQNSKHVSQWALSNAGINDIILYQSCWYFYRRKAPATPSTAPSSPSYRRNGGTPAAFTLSLLSLQQMLIVCSTPKRRLTVVLWTSFKPMSFYSWYIDSVCVCTGGLHSSQHSNIRWIGQVRCALRFNAQLDSQRRYSWYCATARHIQPGRRTVFGVSKGMLSYQSIIVWWLSCVKCNKVHKFILCCLILVELLMLCGQAKPR